MTEDTSGITPVSIIPGTEFELIGLRPLGGYVGEKKNYNLQPHVTEYTLWSASTIEWVPNEERFKARVLIEHKSTKDIVVLNSWHQDFADAERAIDLVRDSLNQVGHRRIYNVFGETTDIHTSPSAGSSLITVTEVLALIWSMM